MQAGGEIGKIFSWQRLPLYDNNSFLNTTPSHNSCFWPPAYINLAMSRFSAFSIYYIKYKLACITLVPRPGPSHLFNICSPAPLILKAGRDNAYCEVTFGQNIQMFQASQTDLYQWLWCCFSTSLSAWSWRKIQDQKQNTA